jgi:hypothetical protein
MRFCRCSQVTSDTGQLDPTIRHKRKEERLPVSSTTTFFVFQRTVSLFFLFPVIGKEVEKWRDIMWEDVGCAGVTRPALYPHGIIDEEAKRPGSAGTIKRCSKNDFTHHLTPRTMCPTHRGNTTTVSKMGLMIAVGSAKAQGLKVKPVYGLELPRPARVRNEATQRVANILLHSMPHRGDPASSSLVSKSRLGGFLHAPMWAGI